MIPLKKIFPVIVVLISLSLLGIIYIQWNWISSAIHLKKEEVENRIINVVADVQQAMLQRRDGAIRFKMDRPNETGFAMERYFRERLAPPVSSLFTADEITRLIRSSMREHKVDSDFEFAVFSPSVTSDGSILKQSAGFQKMIGKTVVDSNDYAIRAIYLDPTENMDINRSEKLIIVMPTADSTVMRQMTFMILGSSIFTLIIVAAFALTIRTMLNQKKLSEIKSDFINNMTHELKTPLATISLAIDAIGNEKVMDNKDKIRYFSGIIKEENKRMNKQVETILQSALLEKDEIGLKLQPTDVHHVIQHTVENLQLQLAAKEGQVQLQLDAIHPVIQADDVHFSNVIFNLLDNAIKYSNQRLEVNIHTYNTRKSLIITISDNGIGMNRDTISRIFEKFYRAHTGNVHNVKGFGLGLAYVKAMVDAHKGKIKVESTVGKGSKFTIEFPQE